MHFRDLNEAQILALAITAEEEHIYRDSAELFTRMAEELTHAPGV